MLLTITTNMLFYMHLCLKCAENSLNVRKMSQIFIIYQLKNCIGAPCCLLVCTIYLSMYVCIVPKGM